VCVTFDCCICAVLAASDLCVGISDVRRSYKSISGARTLNPLVPVYRPLRGLRRVYPLIAVTSAGATTSQVTGQVNVLVYKTRSVPILNSLWLRSLKTGLCVPLGSTCQLPCDVFRSFLFPDAGCLTLKADRIDVG
jgi:hypothetical protein